MGTAGFEGMRPPSGGFPPPRTIRSMPASLRASGGGFLASPLSRASGGGFLASPRERRAEPSSPALPRERRAEASSPASPGERRAEAFAPAPLFLGYTATPNSPKFLQNSCFIYEKRKCSFTFKIEKSLVITINKSIFKRNHEMISRSLRSCW